MTSARAERQIMLNPKNVKRLSRQAGRVLAYAVIVGALLTTCALIFDHTNPAQPELNMDNEPYRVIGHHEARDITAAILRERGGTASTEHKLPSGKICDVFHVSAEGIIEIFEVKTTIKPSLLDDARSKYAHWCNRLWVVVPAATYQHVRLVTDEGCWRSGREMIGLMGVCHDALYALRTPCEQTIHPKLRQALLETLTPS